MRPGNGLPQRTYPPNRIGLFVLQAWAARTCLESANAAGSKDVNDMAKLNPFKFMQEVRQETNKVTWPSRKETGITTAMVFIFAALAAVFFLLADQVIRIAVTLVLGIGT
jgi:preprotein translocase subunit SecE